MKLKKGMYVRTKDGDIHKCLDVYLDCYRPHLNRFVDEWGNIYMFDELKGEASFYPIDLVEVGDIVEVYVFGLENDGITKIIRPETLNELKKMKKNVKKGRKIYGIVTSQQFKNAIYKVDEQIE